ncbi:MAG: hypothetical protein GY855_05930 [candidate division Zixibacteria bacterium]|nr:hypothetical protein [candidate division Zixibacteria bacterium]
MPFCPKCRSEYIAHTMECPDCGVELVDSLPESEDCQDEGYDDSELRLLYSTPEMAFAELVRGALESEGIHCLMKRSTGIHAQFGAMLPGSHSLFKLWVTGSNFDKAKRIKDSITGENEE